MKREIKTSKNTTKKRKAKVKKVLLTVSGRMKRSEDCVSNSMTLFLKKRLNADIKKYCHGNKQAVINYLAKQGLDEIIKKGKFVCILE